MATNTTIEIKLIQQLKVNGHSEVPPRSAKSTQRFTVFDIPKEPGVFLFVGRAGALRKGRVCSESISLVGPVRDKLIKQWDEAHPKRVTKKDVK